MSFVRLPDPNPGRCENFRTLHHADGFVEVVRCLDYEASRHVCAFPEPEHRVVEVNGYTMPTAQTPVPWVRPDERVVARG